MTLGLSMQELSPEVKDLTEGVDMEAAVIGGMYREFPDAGMTVNYTCHELGAQVLVTDYANNLWQIERDASLRATEHNLVAALFTRPIKSFRYPATLMDHFKHLLWQKLPRVFRNKHWKLFSPRYIEIEVQGWLDVLPQERARYIVTPSMFLKDKE